MATGEVRQAGPALHPARGIRISQRFSDVRKVGPSGSLLANAALLPFRRSLGPFSERGRGGNGGSHGNSVGTVVCGDRVGRKGGRAQRGKCALEPSQAEALRRLGPTAIARRLTGARGTLISLSSLVHLGGGWFDSVASLPQHSKSCRLRRAERWKAAGALTRTPASFSQSTTSSGDFA